MEFDDSVSTAQAQAAGLGSPSFSSFGDDASYANQSAGSSGGSDSNFTIGIDPNRMSDNMFTNYVNAGSNNVPNVFDLGGGVGDFGFGNTRSQNFLNPQLAEMYKQQEIARTGVNLDKNPFVDSIFTKMLGDSIDRRRDLGSNRIQEINDLRARQAFGLPSLNTGLSYTSKDFEAGRDTNQGMVRELPVGGIESFARSVIPGASLLPRGAAPEQSQMYREAQAKANAPGIMSQTGDFLTDIGNLFTGLFSAKPQIEDFDQFSPSPVNFDNRQIEDFEDRVDIPDFRTNPNVDDFKGIGNFPIIDRVRVNSEELDSMNRDGTGYASAAGSLYPRTTENSPNYTVPGEENLGMTIDRTGLDRYNLNSVDPNFKTEMNKLNSDEREFLTGRTDTIRGVNEDELMADASSFIPQSFKDAGEGLGQLFNEDGVPIGPGNLRFQYDVEKEEPSFKYTIPFTV